MPTWQERFQEALQAPGLLRTGDLVVAAVSGGPDSVALLLMLSEVAPQMGIGVHVAHLDHGWRESPAPNLVLDLARRFSYALTTGSLPRAWARTEEAARRERHRFLERTAHHVGASAILLAHHRADQAETVLMHLLQGAGGRGARGMEAARDRFLRPLLDFSREELVQILREQGAAYDEDPSNRDRVHLRNWLREEILPTLKDRMPGAEGALIRHSVLLRQDEADFEEALDLFFQGAVVPYGPGFLIREAPLAALTPALRSRLSLRLLEGVGRRPSEGQIAALSLALEKGRGGGGRGIGVFPAPQGVWVGPDSLLPPLPEVSLTAGTVISLPEPLAPHLRAQKVGLPDLGALVLRSRRTGDRLVGRSKSLQDLMVDAKVPQPFRNRVPVVAGADGVHVALGLVGPWPRGHDLEFHPEAHRVVVP